MTAFLSSRATFAFIFPSTRRIRIHKLIYSSREPIGGLQDDGVLNSFFSSALNRAQRTLSYVGQAKEVETAPNPAEPTREESSHGLLGSRAFSSVVDEILPRPSNTSNLYGRNPTVTTTALAHSLWSYVIRPGVDSVIDATAGNGGDALVLAKLLFASGQRPSLQSRLVCVDVDPKACDATTRRLQSVFPDLMGRSIHVLPVSHDPLPLSCLDVSVVQSIGLVVYNLGYLPHAAETIMTRTESTLSSLAQAARLLRVGGMISVMTYPGSNKEEDAVVRAFVTGLALLSSRTVDWSSHAYFEGDAIWNQRILEQLNEVVRHYGVGHQVKWRVHEHKKLGWVDAPTLFTATRIN